MIKLKICRSEGGVHYDTYEVEEKPGMTVLGALFYIQDRLDPTLSFRYSCRGAVCGSCAMLINKFPQLACRTQLKSALENSQDLPELKTYPAISDGQGWKPGEEVLVEPLPHLPVIKDLVMDMEPFFEAYKAVEPHFKPVDEDPEKERAMDQETVRELENYTNCILCASCFGACPVTGENPEFLGPAALAKLYRFAADPREGRQKDRLNMGITTDGWEFCHFHTNCKKVCPKGVPPNLGIGKAKQLLIKVRE